MVVTADGAAGWKLCAGLGPPVWLVAPVAAGMALPHAAMATAMTGSAHLALRITSQFLK
jgi:hypothetical protein